MISPCRSEKWYCSRLYVMHPLTTIIAAPGTSCRHQVKDGTGKKALHPVEILHDALL